MKQYRILTPGPKGFTLYGTLEASNWAVAFLMFKNEFPGCKELGIDKVKHNGKIYWLK